MKCKNVQELLLSDYTDKELSLEKQIIIDGHLTNCLKCREISNKIRHTGAFFQKSKQYDVPQKVWFNIHSTIIKNNLKTKTNALYDLINFLKIFFFMPKNILVSAGTFTGIIFFLIILGTSSHFFFNSVNTFDIEEYSVDSVMTNNLETNIEKYFM
ncbi:hypothetical protein OMAG_001151 [Candidatus Omnitrophus magneticus]|uniref:Zinc-finger domain-containing protein n=1 Tax=Candidatus Omnitrophus magneticus TaxID=1609969 RepID=A0A0F0CTQ6_9BACT|nr:hypothetical protein OMAG_001151 [Candidatus Omnitrophus magneticus]